MAEADECEVEAQGVSMAESTTAMTSATQAPITKLTTMAAGTSIGPGNGTGAPDPNV